jgi:hypothetical protein
MDDGMVPSSSIFCRIVIKESKSTKNGKKKSLQTQRLQRKKHYMYRVKATRAAVLD